MKYESTPMIRASKVTINIELCLSSLLNVRTLSHNNANRAPSLGQTSSQSPFYLEITVITDYRLISRSQVSLSLLSHEDVP